MGLICGKRPASYCNTLQDTAVYCNIECLNDDAICGARRTATHCNTLQHRDGSFIEASCVAVCCSVLQWVAVCCSASCARDAIFIQALYVAVCCSVLHCVAVRCSVFRCVAVCCSALQYVLYHYESKVDQEFTAVELFCANLGLKF